MDHQLQAPDRCIWICPNCAGVASGSGRVGPDDWRCSSCGHVVPQEDGIPTFAPELAESTEGYDPKFFELTASIEDRHFWFVPRRRLLSTLISRHFPAARSYLEIGCGTGDMLTAVVKAKTWQSVHGSDLHPSSLKRVALRLAGRVGLVQLDARAIPAKGQFDVITAFDVIEHIVEDEQVLKSMYSALAPGGGAVLAVPQHPFLWSHSDDIGHHVRRYRAGELEQKLKRAGFEVMYSTSYMALLLPLLLASRLAYKYRKKPAENEPDGLEYDVPRVLNALLRMISQVEVSLALAGVRFAAGGSRIVVARK